ncbi:MAG: hypothetical protein R2873_10575 [Caldilineaceae bacterium]
MEEAGKPEEASKLFLEAWDEATNDHEKFLAAHYVARHQNNVSDRLKWLETALQFALKLDDATVKSAFPALYAKIAQCYDELNEPDKAKQHYKLAALSKDNPVDNGPFITGREQICGWEIC